MSGDKASKTEKATPKKVQDSRKEGQVGKSPEVAAWSSMLAISLLVPWTMSRASQTFLGMGDQMKGLIAQPDQGAALGFFADGLRQALILVLPMAVGLALVAIAAGAIQVGLKITPKALKPKFTSLNPLTGFKRLLGAQSWWGAVKELTKLGLLSALAYRAMKNSIPDLLVAGALPLTSVMASVGSAALSFLRAASGLGLILAAADYAIQRQQTGKQMRMSKQDIKDEHKQADGDPQMKGAIRQRQMSMSRNRMMADVASADVVLVNPTHVAVALRYRPDRGAPQVVAKGSGVIAAKIRERADQERIPMVRDIALARAIHAACDVGDAVPPELYGAVAQVLAFVFGLKARGTTTGTHRVPVPAHP